MSVEYKHKPAESDSKQTTEIGVGSTIPLFSSMSQQEFRLRLKPGLVLPFRSTLDYVNGKAPPGIYPYAGVGNEALAQGVVFKKAKDETIDRVIYPTVIDRHGDHIEGQYAMGASFTLESTELDDLPGFFHRLHLVVHVPTQHILEARMRTEEREDRKVEALFDRFYPAESGPFRDLPDLGYQIRVPDDKRIKSVLGTFVLHPRYEPSDVVHPPIIKSGERP